MPFDLSFATFFSFVLSMLAMTGRLLTFATAFFCLTSCAPVIHGYYLSPANGNTVTYHAIPFAKDSVRTANYVSLVYTAGSANDRGLDQVQLGQASFYRSQAFPHFQFYYGANLSLGTYKTGDFANSNYNYRYGVFGPYAVPADTLYHVLENKYFVGGLGFSGGINWVVPFRRVEWRPIGLETSVQKEFGEYRSFRKSLPDSAANIIFRKTTTATFGFYTDLCWTSRHHVQFGFKIGTGFQVNPKSQYSNRDNEYFFPVQYFSQCFHVTKDRFTGYIQGNIATYANNVQFGLAYRLNRK